AQSGPRPVSDTAYPGHNAPQYNSLPACRIGSEKRVGNWPHLRVPRYPDPGRRLRQNDTNPPGRPPAPATGLTPLPRTPPHSALPHLRPDGDMGAPHDIRVSTEGLSARCDTLSSPAGRKGKIDSLYCGLYLPGRL